MTEEVKDAEVVAEDSAPDATMPNAVVVYRIKEDDNSIRCVAEPVGDVLPTEVDTILALARKEYRERIGLGE